MYIYIYISICIARVLGSRRRGDCSKAGPAKEDRALSSLSSIQDSPLSRDRGLSCIEERSVSIETHSSLL